MLVVCKEWRYTCVMLAHQLPPCLYCILTPTIKNLACHHFQILDWTKGRQIEGSEACKRQIKGGENMVLRGHKSLCNPILMKWLLPLDAVRRQENLSALPIFPSGNYQRYFTCPLLSGVGAKTKYHKKFQRHICFSKFKPLRGCGLSINGHQPLLSRKWKLQGKKLVWE